MDSVSTSERGRDTEPGSRDSPRRPGRPESTPPPSVLHEVLVNDRRRAVVDLLDEGRSLRDLADDVARIETGDDDPDRKTRQSVYITLHQCHLPKLDEYGIVAYDADRKRVQPTDGLWAIRSYRDRVKESRTRGQHAGDPRPYLGLGLLGTVCLTAGSVGVAPTLAWTVACGAALCVVALAGRAVWARRRD
jgi:hypothetical protein